ncbi:MAG: SRPBCC domain-containing protein [Bdellovibrio sp.]|nr:SRPBCC domain-containing protein [Bdellovibrio sp.]
MDQSDRQIITTRIIGHSRDAVFNAWADPKLLAQWWGPHGFTNTFEDFYFKPGGVWNFVMHGPDGTNYQNHIRFVEIHSPRIVILEHLSIPHFHVRATFDDLGKRTKISYQATFDSIGDCEEAKKYAIEANEQNLDRLTSLLDRGSNEYTPNPKLDLVLERFVELPPNLMWQAWTQPEILKHWFCPRPWKAISCEIDLRPGGIFNTIMRSPEGKDSPLYGCFLEVVENNRLVWTDTLLANYRPAQNPFFTAIVTFEPHDKGTKYRAVAIHKDEVIRKQHEEMGFHHGWSVALEQLVEYMKRHVL